MAGLALGEHVEEPGRKGAVRRAAGEAGNQPSPWRKGQVRASHMWFWNLPGVPLGGGRLRQKRWAAGRCCPQPWPQ